MAMPVRVYPRRLHRSDRKVVGYERCERVCQRCKQRPSHFLLSHCEGENEDTNFISWRCRFWKSVKPYINGSLRPAFCFQISFITQHLDWGERASSPKSSNALRWLYRWCTCSFIDHSVHSCAPYPVHCWRRCWQIFVECFLKQTMRPITMVQAAICLDMWVPNKILMRKRLKRLDMKPDHRQK